MLFKVPLATLMDRSEHFRNMALTGNWDPSKPLTEGDCDANPLVLPLKSSDFAHLCNFLLKFPYEVLP
jgi:hypothetical protein